MKPYVEWCPGNGTRYALSFSVLPMGGFGHAAGTVMVVGPSYYPRSVMFFDPNDRGALTWQYVSEKMKLNMSDAAPVTEMIAVVLGRKPILPKREDIQDPGDGSRFVLPA